MKPIAWKQRLIFLLFLFFFHPDIALCATQIPSDISSGFRVIWGLLVVLGVLFVIYGLMKKKMSFLNMSGKGLIKIVEVRHLMPKKSLYLVEVRGREFLLGAGHERIDLIAAINPEPTDSFAEVLKQSSTEERQ